MTIIYRCDRCGSETKPDKLYEVEVSFTPHALDGGEDTDKEDRKWLGQLCAECTDVVEPLLQALVQPPTANAVREDVASPIVPLRGNADPLASSPFADPLIGWGDTREKAD